MNIDALHSALLSLALVTEEMRSLRANAAEADLATFDAADGLLATLERELNSAKTALARELGFSIESRLPSLAIATTRAEPIPPEPLPATKSPRRSSSKRRQVDRFTRTQRASLLQLRDALVDTISLTARDNRADREGCRARSFAGDEADAGSDAFEKDFALRLLSQEHDALSQIDHALKRIDAGVYGICELSGKPIPRERLEAIPFARYTVECQAQLEKKERRGRSVPAFVWETAEYSEPPEIDPTEACE